MESKSPPHSSRLIIDNDAIAANFRDLARRVAPATCGAVIKADGYGLGAANVAPALLHAGCRSFFVARPSDRSIAQTVSRSITFTAYARAGAAGNTQATC